MIKRDLSVKEGVVAMRISSLIYRATLLAGLFLSAVGCGDMTAPPMAPVRGKVLFKGKPLTAGTIVFAPDAVKGTSGPLARGTIHPDGTYALQSGETYGAVVGWHRVTVSAVE